MRRHEDMRLLTGQGRYTDDITLPRMAQAFVLRSPWRTPSSNASMPPRPAHAGVLLVLTGEGRSDGWASAMCPARRRSSAATASRGTTRRVPPRVRARSPRRSAGCSRRRRDLGGGAGMPPRPSRSKYEALPSVTETKDALAPGAAQLFDHIAGTWCSIGTMTRATPRQPTPTSPRPHTRVSLELVNNRVVVKLDGAAQRHRRLPIRPAAARHSIPGRRRSAFRPRPARRNHSQDCQRQAPLNHAPTSAAGSA